MREPYKQCRCSPQSVQPDRSPHVWYSLCSGSSREDVMLYTLAVILLIAWLLGVVWKA